jgi:hypothetical protein
MSYLEGDLPDEAEPFFREDSYEPHKCEICHKSLSVEGSDYCLACSELEAAEEAAALPVLQPIEQRPVELNAVLWKEWKSIAEKMS